MIKIKSLEGEFVLMDKKTMSKCGMIKNLIGDIDGSTSANDDYIELQYTKENLLLSIEFCEKDLTEDMAKNWAMDKVNNLSKEKIQEFLMLSNYIDNEFLCDSLCYGVSRMIEDMDREHVRDRFDCTTEYTPDQLKKVMEDNAWCFY